MALNFNSLSDKPDNPNGFNNTISVEDWPEDFYPCVIEDATMKTPKRKTDADGKLLPQAPDYLSVRLGIMKNGKRVAACFDMLFESEKPALQYKVKQFLKGIDLVLEGDFELSDLTKLIVGKELLAKLAVEENAQYGNSLRVQLFDDVIYKPINSETGFSLGTTQAEPYDGFVPAFADSDTPPEMEEIEY